LEATQGLRFFVYTLSSKSEVGFRRKGVGFSEHNTTTH